MQTQDKYEKCVVVKQNSNNQTVAKVYFHHNGEYDINICGSLSIGGPDGVAIGNKSVIVATHLYHTENITDPNAIQQSLMGDSSHHD